MKKFFGFTLSLGMAFAFWACSQTVSGSDDSVKGSEQDDFIPGFNSPSSNSSGNSDKGNSAGKGNSSSSKGSNQSSSESWADDWDDDWFNDFGNSSASSGMDFAKYVPEEKLDCEFSVDDDTWQIKQVEADSSIDMTIKFKDNMDLWVSIVSEGKAESEEECQQSAALLSVFGAMAAASDETDMTMFATCEGDKFKMTVQGTADEKYTPEQKSEMYSKICK